MKLSKELKYQLASAITAKIHNDKIAKAKDALKKVVIDQLLADGHKLAKDIPPGFERYMSSTSCVGIPKKPIGWTQIDVDVQFCDPRYETLHVPREIEKSQEWINYHAAHDEKEAFFQSISDVLVAHNTDTQLIETLPEIAEFLPEVTVKSGAVVAIETVNKVRRAMTGNREVL